MGRFSTRLTRMALVLCALLFWTGYSFASEDDDNSGEATISGDIFGEKAPWYHGYLSLYGAYDDNIFNTENEAESDFITVISPGIQLTIPGTDQPAEAIVTDTTTPGGLVFGRFTEPTPRRFRAYVGYAPWFQFYANNPDQNLINQFAQAGVQYNLRGGLSFDLVNRFVQDYNELQPDRSPKDEQFYANVLNLIATYPLSPKFQLRAEYTNNFIDYINDELYDFRNRTDNSVAASVNYRFRPKTTAFVELRYTDIDYDTDNDRDGDLQNAYLGLTWDAGAKTRGRFQAGYGLRRYDNPVFEEADLFTFRGTVDYRFTPKTFVDLRLFQRIEESTEEIYDYAFTSRAALGYHHMLRHNLDFDLELLYEFLNYQGGEAELLGVPDRKDNIWLVTPTLSYAFRRWLSVSAGYIYRNRDSNIELLSFKGNTFFVKLTGSI